MKWHVSFKGFEGGLRLSRMLDRLRATLERQVKIFAEDLVYLRGIIEKHATRMLFRVSLLLDVPGRTLVAKEERPEAELALKDAFQELERQLKKHKAFLRREPIWKRREGRKEPAQAVETRSLPLPERERMALLDVVYGHLDKLYSFARREIAAHLASGQLLPGQVTAEDIVDAVVLRAARDFHRRPETLPIDRWLLKMAIGQVEAEVERLRKTGRDARLEDAASRRASEDEIYDFYQPDEVLRLEDLVPAPFIPTPEQVFESRELQRYINQTLAQLPKRWRLAFVLHHGEGCSIAETAHLLEMTERDAAEALERARVFLSQKLAEVRLAVPA